MQALVNFGDLITKIYQSPLVGDHERGAGQIPAGSLVAPVDPDADPVFLRG